MREIYSESMRERKIERGSETERLKEKGKIVSYRKKKNFLI